MTRITLTLKQTQILEVVAAKNVDGTLIDLDQLLERLPYETTKQSIHFSLRALIKREYLTKAGQESRRHRSRVLIDLGTQGKALYGLAAAAKPALTVTPDEDALEVAAE